MPKRALPNAHNFEISEPTANSVRRGREGESGVVGRPSRAEGRICPLRTSSETGWANLNPQGSGWHQKCRFPCVCLLFKVLKIL